MAFRLIRLFFNIYNIKKRVINDLKFSYIISKIICITKIIFIVDFNKDFNKELKTLLGFKKRMFILIKENSFNKC